MLEKSETADLIDEMMVIECGHAKFVARDMLHKEIESGNILHEASTDQCFYPNQYYHYKLLHIVYQRPACGPRHTGWAPGIYSIKK